MPDLCLGPGDYSLSCGVGRDVPVQKEEDMISYYWKVIFFKVNRKSLRGYTYKVEPPVCWELKQNPSESSGSGNGENRALEDKPD